MSDCVNLVEVSHSPNVVVGVVDDSELNNRRWVNRLSVSLLLAAYTREVKLSYLPFSFPRTTILAR